MSRIWLLAPVLFLGAILVDTAAAQCNENCLTSPDNEKAETCNETTGECFFGCQKTWTGPNCTVRCPYNCEICTLDMLNSTDTTCEQCHSNFYLDGNCKLCKTHCAVPTTDIRKCADKTGFCNAGCENGYFGSICTYTCDIACLDKKCDQLTSHCHGCKYRTQCGDDCKSKCSVGCYSEDSIDGQCHQNCTCDAGCKQNFYGQECVPCSESCTPCNSSVSNRTCNIATGECICGCKDKISHGLHCEDQCPDNCVNNECQQSNGDCLHGCKTGYYGPHCEDRCDKNCLHKVCATPYGECVDGCLNKWYGEFCTRTCGKNCVNGTCERVNGNCVLGCAKGFSGDSCDQDASGVAGCCFVEGAATGTGVVAAAIVVGVIVTCVFYKKGYRIRNGVVGTMADGIYAHAPRFPDDGILHRPVIPYAAGREQVSKPT